MATARVDAGSFRDRGGRIYHVGDRVFRSVQASAADDYQFTRGSGLIQRLIDEGILIGETAAAAETLGSAAPDAVHFLEHPRLPFVSWPYEWPFGALKAAAILHLDIQLRALDVGVVLSDASAYNVQFQGCRPIFIDSLSFRRYRDGEFWTGHRQFCEQFLNPLLLQSKLGTAFQPWFRGSLGGISSTQLNALLPWHDKLSWNMVSQVWLQARLEGRATEKDAKARIDRGKYPKRAYRETLAGLKRWIERLEPKRDHESNWQDYARNHSYADAEAAAKQAFVDGFVRRRTPGVLLDCGCNSGDYSLIALAAGARSVVGIDFDEAAADLAFQRAQAGRLNFLPLVMDATNPSPSQGWQQSERPGFAERVKADALLALALVHHLVITENLRLEQVVDWLTGLAPEGVIEFIPKADPMVERLLSLREDIFTDYSEENFEGCLARRAEITAVEQVSRHGRKLYGYRRHA